jgi:hypothetical protein
MNETQDPSTHSSKPGRMVRAFLIALPVGLAFMVPISLWIYYQKKHRPQPATSQYAPMLRKELNADDFARYTRILAQDIGDRSLAQPEHLDAAVRFVESTMDFANMGYNVQRQAFEAGGKPVVNIVAELPGKSKPDEIIWVIAEYDAADASGIAALMCVAHALTGTEHSRTIRFAAVVNAHTLVETENGMDNLTRFNAGKSQAPRTIVDLSGLMTSPPEAWKQVEIRHLALLLRVYPIVPLEAMQKILWEVEKAADAP